MQKKLLLFSLFFFSIQYIFSQNFDFNPNCKLAYQAIFKLKIEEGLALIEKEKKENPKNYLIFFIENYADFLKLYLNDNVSLYKQTLSKFNATSEKLKNGDKKSAFYLYTLADIHLQTAFCKLKFGDYLSAVFEIKKAYGLLQENQKKYPDFKPNLKSIGLLHALFGAIPDNYKFGAKLLGFKGTIDQGIKELNTVLQDPTFEFKEEALIEYTLLLLHLKKNKLGAWSMINNTNIPLEDNLLNYFIAATVAANMGKNEEVISILSKKPSTNNYLAFPFLDYLLGNAKLNKLDADADTYLKKFISNNKGRSYQKEANRKLAWFYLIHNNTILYKKHLQQILSIKEMPTDEDKSAQKEALQNYIPNVFLLKARVLFDGGYYTKALEVINQIPLNSLTREKDKIEYYYRKARIYHEQNNTNEAIKSYLLTIEKGNMHTYFFIANAALKLGNIFETQQKKASAIQYYRKAIALEKDEYTNSINAEAKAGLNRLGNE